MPPRGGWRLSSKPSSLGRTAWRRLPTRPASTSPPSRTRWARCRARICPRGVGGAALLFATCGRRPAFTEDARALVVELAARVSAAFEAAERFQQPRRVSLALQAAMLSVPPRHPLVEVQARYLPAAADLEV